MIAADEADGGGDPEEGGVALREVPGAIARRGRVYRDARQNGGASAEPDDRGQPDAGLEDETGRRLLALGERGHDVHLAKPMSSEGESRGLVRNDAETEMDGTGCALPTLTTLNSKPVPNTAMMNAGKVKAQYEALASMKARVGPAARPHALTVCWKLCAVVFPR